MLEKIQILLDVADQIEKSSFYSGKSWWNNKEEHQNVPFEEKGCAMTRIALKSGEEVNFEGRGYISYISEKYIGDIVDSVTDIKHFWSKYFIDWSFKATKEDTIMVLRLLGNKEFDFDKTIDENIEEAKMPKTKLESLEKLKELIGSGDLSLATGEYCDDGNNCVIGHLLKIGGLTDDHLAQLDNGKYGCGSYGIDSIIDKSLQGDIENDFVKDTLEKMGFDLGQDNSMLYQLQKYNDGMGKDELIQRIDEYIEQIKSTI